MKFLTLALVATLLSFQVMAAQWAYISSSESIVYADKELTSPIGHIKYGKKVRVGEVKRIKETILPIIVSGKLCYIQTKDLVLDELDNFKDFKNPKLKEHSYIAGDEFLKKFSEDNYLSISVQTTGVGDDLEQIAADIGSEEPISAQIIGVEFDHRPGLDRYSWGVGINYLKAGSADLNFSAINLELNFNYSLYKNKFFNFELTAGGLLSGNAKISSEFIEKDTQGILLGTQFGGLIRLFPYSKYGVSIGARFKSASVKSLNSEDFKSNSGQVLSLTSIKGSNLFANIHLKL